MDTSHSKVIATSIICLALIGSVLIYDKKESLFAQKLPPQAKVVVDNSAATSAPVDTNWEKSLATISDPIQIVVSQNTTGDTTGDDTLTSQISKEFFSLYLADKKNGVTIDQNEAIRIANQTISNLNITSPAKQYGIQDVKITSDSSSASMAAYRQKMVQVVQNDLSKNTKNPLDIMNIASQSEQNSDLAPLDPIIANYQAAIRDILAIEIPQKAIGDHMVYLNTISALLTDVQGMKKILSDPVIGYLSFSNYQTDTVKLQLVIQGMNKDLAN